MNVLGSGSRSEVMDLTLDSDDETNEVADGAGAVAAGEQRLSMPVTL